MKDHGAPMEMSCAACHRPHAKGAALAACTECHVRAQMARGGLHAKRGHVRCLDCHRPHVWTPEPARCLSCHEDAPAHAEARACAECHSFRGAPLPRPARAGTP